MKKIAVAVGALGLAMAVPSVLPASAAPTQSASVSCSKAGNTTVTTNGGVAQVLFQWYANNGDYVTGSWDYSSPWSKVTPNQAKTARVTVFWQGNNASTLYAVACK